MKPRHPSKVERHLPSNWWKRPMFDVGLNYRFPYIWFMYWLISWEWDDYQLPLLERRIVKFHGISFMPD